jgi:hypothetical protein
MILTYVSAQGWSWAHLRGCTVGATMDVEGRIRFLQRALIAAGEPGKGKASGSCCTA